MRSTATRKTHAALPVFHFFCGLLLCFLFLSCPGNGSSVRSDGSSYVPGGGTSAGTGGSSGGTSSSPADDILSKINTGDIETLVQLFSGGRGGGSGSIFDESTTRRISFSASDIGMPADGSVTLTLTSGSEEYSCTGTVASDGNVYFDIPVIQSGATVTVQMDVRNSANVLVMTGSSSKNVSGDSDNLAVTLNVLSDRVELQLSVPSGVNYYVYRVSSDGGSSWEYKKASGSSVISAKIGDTVTVEGFALVTSEERLYKFSTVSCLATEDASLLLELDSTKKMDAASPVVSYTAPTIGYSLEYIIPLSDFKNQGLFSFGAISYTYSTDGGGSWNLASLTGSPGDEYRTGSVATTLSTGNLIQLVSRLTLGDGFVDWQTVRTIP